MGSSRHTSVGERILRMVCAAAVIGLAAGVPRAAADTTDFGGHPDKFKGAGDKIPPRCQIDIPRATTDPFFIQWNCTDDNADAQDIRSELWIFRKGAPAAVLLAPFLGFPASVRIDESVLQAASVADGLPASFRLVAIDRAGITSLSPILTVAAQDNSVDTCTLRVTTDATASTGSTTGSPELTVLLDDAAVNVNQLTNTSFRVASKTEAQADPCEIDVLCFDESNVRFESSLSTSDDDGATAVKGTVSIIPGSLTVEVEGTTELDGVILRSLEASGRTRINGADADVTLTCNQ